MVVVVYARTFYVVSFEFVAYTHTDVSCSIARADGWVLERTNERTVSTDRVERRTSELGEETWGRTIGFGTMRYVDDAGGRVRSERLENKGRARALGLLEETAAFLSELTTLRFFI